MRTDGPPRSQTLDWFRGVGILAVIWGHAGLSGLPGAYLFIDTFFVISGYLVSRSLDRALTDSGRQDAWRSILSFLSSRFRRIVIPLAAAVLITLCAGWFVLLPDDLMALAVAARASLLLQAHLYALTLGNYFTAVGQTSPLLHTWSLSLEEWFYLLTPILVLPLLYLRRSLWLWFLVAAVGLSLYRAQTLAMDPEAMGAGYYLFGARLWEFLLGAVVGLALRKPVILPSVVNDGLILAGLVLVFGSVLILTEKAPSPGVISLPAVIGVLPVLVLRPYAAWVIRATGSAVVTFFGRRLYSLYLAHYPVMVLFDYLLPQSATTGDTVKLVVAILISLGFHAVFEAPFKGWRNIGFSRVACIAGGLVAGCIGMTSLILLTAGAPNRLPDTALSAWTARFAVNPSRADCMRANLTGFGYSCALGPSDRPFVALFGDSHSDTIAHQLALSLASPGVSLRHYWYGECPAIGSGLQRLGVFSATCVKLSHSAHRAALSDPNLAGVIYMLRWPWYLNDPDDDVKRAYWRGSDGLPVGYTDMVAFRMDMREVLRDSSAGFRARGVPVVVVGPVPSLPLDPVRSSALSLWHGAQDFGPLSEGVSLARAQEERGQTAQMLSDLEREGLVTVLDPRAALCDRRSCAVFSARRSLYSDDNHLNEDGAARLVRALFLHMMVKAD